MENIHETPLVTLLNSAKNAFGEAAALTLVERTLSSLLTPTQTTMKDDFETPTAQIEVQLPDASSPISDALVMGLPDGLSWEQVPVETKLVQGPLRTAMELSHGIVLRREDSSSGDLYYAKYSKDDLAFLVPSGYETSRGRAQLITVNGAYRWVMVGVAKQVKRTTQRAVTRKAATLLLTLPKHRGRCYEPCHEEMASAGNVRAGMLVRDVQNGSLDYIAAYDGTTALVERENGDLDGFKLSAQPSKLLRIVGYSSQYAEEAEARG